MRLARTWPWIAAAAAAAPGQQSPPVRDLRGTVAGAAGERVRITVLHHDPDAADLEPVAERYSEPDGSFAFNRVPWYERDSRAHASVLVVARTRQRIAVCHLRGEPAPTADLRIELTDPVDVTGVLTDQDGAPVAAASVWPAIFGDHPKDQPSLWPASPLLPWQATTDAHGRFALKGLPGPLPMRLVAGSPDFARQWIVVKDPRQPIQATMIRGGTIPGVVLLPDGQPAVHVRVRAQADAEAHGLTVTDDAGHFALTALRAGIYKVWAEAPDLTVIACLDVAVEPGATAREQQVQLVRGGFIVGRILDAETGKPIVPGDATEVAMYGPARGNGGACEVARVLADGTFRIRAPAGRNRIYLRNATGFIEPSEQVDVTEDRETRIEWRLRKPR